MPGIVRVQAWMLLEVPSGVAERSMNEVVHSKAEITDRNGTGHAAHPDHQGRKEVVMRPS